MELLEVGEKIHVIERRYFEEDLRRHFVGEVTRSSQSVVRCLGYVWVYNTNTGAFERKLEKRERVLNLAGDSRQTINVIPQDTNIEAIVYLNVEGEGLVVTDKQTFRLNVVEFSASR